MPEPYLLPTPAKIDLRSLPMATADLMSRSARLFSDGYLSQHPHRNHALWVWNDSFSGEYSWVVFKSWMNHHFFHLVCFQNFLIAYLGLEWIVSFMNCFEYCQLLKRKSRSWQFLFLFFKKKNQSDVGGVNPIVGILGDIKILICFVVWMWLWKGVPLPCRAWPYHYSCRGVAWCASWYF